jgi:hypothetical protein
MPKYTECLDVTVPEGVYDFVVADANEKMSQSSGSAMIELLLLVKGQNGEEVKIFDNLVFSPKAFWKIDAFRVATGDKLVAGQSVEFNAEDCLDRTGKCVLIIDNYGGRERNKVGEYLDPKESQNPVVQKPTAVPVDDEIPMH